jgi:hydroxyacid-oxoacid transhydrogenase
LDVLCHALESFTAIPFDQRPMPKSPVLRPAYQGSNPISDIWAERAIRLVATYLLRAVADPDDDEARSNMILASSFAGMGFGNAGCHLPHGMSYPVSGMIRDFRPQGFVTDHAIVPHGMSVVLNAPPVFRFTGPACPERHLQAAEWLGADTSSIQNPESESGPLLANCIVDLMKKLEVPNGLSAIGYTEDDIPALVEGTLPQHRVTKLSPRPASADDLTAMFKDALTAW